MQSIIILLILFYSFLCQDVTDAKEFEENEIKSEIQQFSYKAKKTSMVILIVKNGNYNPNSFETKTLTVFDRIIQKSKDYALYGLSYFILDDTQNEEEIDLILKFKNYKDGYFIIYNSDDAFPIKNFEKGFNLKYSFSSEKKDISLSFYSEILKDNIYLDINPEQGIAIKKLTDTGEEEALQIKNNFVELPKDYKYIIEYNNYVDNIEIAFKKREIIHYKINDEIKLNLYNLIPYYILIKPSDYNSDIIYSYLYYYDYISYEIEISEVDSEFIDNWDKIEFLNKTRKTTQKVYEIYNQNINKTYLLIKLTVLKFSRTIENNDNYYTFKIFVNFRTELDPILSQEETLIIQEWRNQMIFISSTFPNLRTFEIKEPNSIIYQRKSEYFPFIVLPTEESYVLDKYRFNNNLFSEIYFDEKSFHNYLSNVFDSLIKPRLWYFDINESFTLYINSQFGSPKIYYTDEINQEIIDDLENKKFEKVKKYNISNDIIQFDSPFALYIDPYENSYLNFILNKDENMNVMKETSNKYLIKNKEYLLKAPSKLMARIDENFNSNIVIFKDGAIISTLNKKNPSILINEPNKDLIFKSEENGLINLYYKINDLFFDEPNIIIIFPNDKIDEIMVVKILSEESKPYYYAINYGYDEYISSDTKKILTSQTYFYIDDPYSIMIEKNENIKHYLILFDQNINYEISYLKKYQKEKNSFYYKIQPKENYAIISDLNYPSDYFTYEFLLCANENINITTIDINNQTQNLIADKTLINQSNKRALFTFESESEFIFFQKENYGYPVSSPEIKYYIPKIENGKISVVLVNNNFEFNTEYTFILLEDNNKDNGLIQNLDNECFFFSFINNEIMDDINYSIKKNLIYNGKFILEELDYTKFSDSKYLLIKIYSCKNEKDICVFSKTQRIFLENLKKDEEEELGVTKIEEFTEYKITREEYIFSYDYKNYLNNLEDIFIYISSPATKTKYIGEVEVINPSLQSFIFKYRHTETIPLIKDKHVVSNGKYYFIFRNCSSVTFYLHNTAHFFSLNKINNYISETDRRISNGDGLIYFNLDLEEDKYVYLEWNTGKLYLYSINNKTTTQISPSFYNTHYINKGSYLLILDYDKNFLGYHFSININHYIVDLPKNKEIKVDMGTSYIYQPTVVAVVDLSKYENELYLVSDSKYANIITCEKSLDIENIIKNGNFGDKYLDTHIIKLDEINSEKCDPPYYNIKLFTSRFELVSDAYNISTSQNITLIPKETTAFTIGGEGYILVFSDQDNLKWLENMQNEYIDTIISKEPIQFKVKPNEDTETTIRIKIVENKYNNTIDILTNEEISLRLKYNDTNKEIKYYINFSKNKYLINHFDYFGKLEFYISKEEMNENIIEEILKTNDINMNLFDLVTQDKFEVDSNKIFAIKKENKIFSELLISPLNNAITVDLSNSKFLLANKKYFMVTYVTIVLEENSDSIIKVYDFDNNEIDIIDKNKPVFENKNYNKALFLKSDKDTLIYIYYLVKENARSFSNQKDNNILILLRSDCEYDQFKYCFDNGFDNYSPLNLELKELNYSQLIIDEIEKNETIIQKWTNYTINIQCEKMLVRNLSGFYENLTIKEGSDLIKNNKNIYIKSDFPNDKKNIFYQIFECGQDNFEENNFYVSIDGNDLEQLNINNSSFINGEDRLEFYFKTKDECFINYYRSPSGEEKYNNLEQNENPYFNITFISRQQSKIDILPKYKNINFEFYFLFYLDKENKIRNNSLSNKCYMKKSLTPNNDNDITEKIFVKKIVYKDGKIINNTIDMPNLDNGLILHSNILGKGIIFENIEEYIFYDEQTHKIKDSDFPKPPDDKSYDIELSIGAIIGIAISGIAIILIAIFLIFFCRKKEKSVFETSTGSLPLTTISDNQI